MTVSPKRCSKEKARARRNCERTRRNCARRKKCLFYNPRSNDLGEILFYIKCRTAGCEHMKLFDLHINTVVSRVQRRAMKRSVLSVASGAALSPLSFAAKDRAVGTWLFRDWTELHIDGREDGPCVPYRSATEWFKSLFKATWKTPCSKTSLSNSKFKDPARKMDLGTATVLGKEGIPPKGAGVGSLNRVQAKRKAAIKQNHKPHRVR